MANFYKYVGDGMGVPGLPHEISDDEAAALGVSEILDAAIKNGSYVIFTPLSATQTAPQMEERHFGGEKKKAKKGDS